MNNLTPQEIQELLEMGIDPSSVVSAYDEADLGSFINNTVGKLKNAFVYQPSINPAAPSQGGTAYNVTGLGTGSSVFNAGAPLNVTTPNQPSQVQMTGSNAPVVSAPPQSNPTGLQKAYQKTKEFATKAEDYLKDKYKDKIKDGKSFKPFDKGMQSLMGAVSYGAGMNQAAQVQEQNRMAYQSPFRQGDNTKEYYTEDFIGENDPMYFLNSKVGAKAEAAPLYAANGVPIEAEGGEFYLDPSTGATLPIHGPSHEEGGVKMVAEQGSYIMSDNVKIPGSFVNDMLKKKALPPKKQYTISDVIRQFPQHFDTKTDAEKLADRSLDPIARTSYEMNIKKKLGNVSKLLAYQQTMNGGHGEEQGPQARYGMEINGGAPLSFDYRADELRVKDMQEMQQMQQMQQPPMADDGIKLSPRGGRAIYGFEKTKGTADESGNPIGMPESLTGGENYPFTGGTTNPEIYNQFKDFVKNTIGAETYNKLPDDVRTLLYNFAFVSGIDTPEKQRRTLAGLAQAIGHATPGSNVPDGIGYRSKLGTQDAVNIIKGVKDFSKLNDIGANYVNVQDDQLGSIAYDPTSKIPAGYRSTMYGRARDVFNLYNDDNSFDVRISPTKPGTIESSTDGGNTFTTIPNKPLDKPRIDAIDQLVSQGKLTQDQGNILKQSTITPTGSLSIPYSAQAAGIDKTTLGQVASYLGNRYIGFSNIPEDVKTIYGQNVSIVPGSSKKQFYDKVSNKTFNSKEEYEKFKTENPDVYKDYGRSLENYTTMEQYTPTKLGNNEAVDVLKKYKSPSASLDKYVLDKNKLLGEDGKIDPRKVDELSTAFNSLEGGTVGKDGKKRFRYTDEKGKTHDIWQLSTPGFKKGTFFAGIDPEIASAYYVYKTYGEDVYNQNKDKPNALKNIWGKDTLGLDDAALNSEVWTSNKFFTDPKWTEKYNEAAIPETLRAAHGNDNKYGFDHLTPRFTKKLDPTLEEKITPGFGEMQFEGEPDESIIPTPPKKTPPYKEHLPLGQYMGLLPSPRTQNYLSQYRQERYEPNLVSLRSAKNDQVAAMNSMLQQQGMDPATMSARQASLYGEAAKNIGAITEQENNTNAQILNQAKAQNAQMATQTNALQEAANKQYVTENAQDLAALDADRYKKLTDLYSAQQKVNQYNKTLKFLDDHAGPNYDYGVDKEGNVTLTRNDKQATFDPTTLNAQQILQLQKALQINQQNTETPAPGNNPTNPNTKQTTPPQPTNASTPTTNRIGGAVKKRSRLII